MDLISAVRLEIGDTEIRNGILPGKRQFKDAEILYAAEQELVTEENSPTSRDVGRTSARLLEIASTTWASQPVEVELGPNVEKGEQASSLSRRALILRSIWGHGAAGRITVERSAPSYSGSGLYVLPPGIG